MVLTASNGVDPDDTHTFTLTVTAPPSITGVTELTLTAGYDATSTGVFTVTGTPLPTLTKTEGAPLITYNETTGKLDIAQGLMPGIYPVVLTASNGVDPDDTHTFTLTVDPKVYEISGGGLHTKITDKEGLEFTSQGDYDDFAGEMTVDGGAALPSTTFEALPGSTVVTLKAAYLDTLEAGTHTLRIYFADGYSETDFEIADYNPQTGEESPGIFAGAGVMIIFAGIA